MSNTISKEQFNKTLDLFGVPSYTNRDFLYEVYTSASLGIEELKQSNPVFANIGVINEIEIIQYCLGEYLYSVAQLSEEKRKEFETNEKIFDSITSVVADKYLSLNKFGLRENRLTNKYFPPMSSIGVYVNLMLTILQNYQSQDSNRKLIIDLLKKSLNISKSITELLMGGFETEALATWRTLHECECALVVLNENRNVIPMYYRHMQFGLAYKDSIKDKDLQDKIFAEMKEEMRGYNLKSKDIKKYIEYGWLYYVPGVKENSEFKLNFRDGLEKVAKLEKYCSRYELSSEIIHSTPILIYSNKEYFYFVTLLSLYESFFSLEKVFVSLFISQATEEAVKQYKMMRDIYYLQLVNIHKRESRNFEMWQNSINKNQD